MYKQKFIDLLQNSGNVCSHEYTSPVGGLLLLSNDDALLAIQYKKKQPFVEFATMPKRKNRPISTCVEILDAYFAQTSRKRLTIRGSLLSSKNMFRITCNIGKKDLSLLLDLSGFTVNEQKVYYALMKTGNGKTISYGQLASRSGLPNAARFVGSTMAKNLFPIIIPCHRVIKSDGSLGNYGGGVDKKRYLLDLELE